MTRVCAVEEVMACMKTAGVPCGPILSIADIMREPQYHERAAFETVSGPDTTDDIVSPALPLFQCFA